MNAKNVLKLIIAIAVSELAGVVGAIFTMPAISVWYAGLAKPELAPPNWVFGPVWTAIYALMGISLYLVWKNNWEVKNHFLENRRKAWNKWSERLWTGDWQKANAIAVFTMQYILNIAWSYLFFGLRMPGLAFFALLALWLAIFWTIVAFYRISKPAAYLLLPYIIWVGFAGYLNYSIWMKNPLVMQQPTAQNVSNISSENMQQAEIIKPIHPLQIEEMRKAEYPGSDLQIERTLANGSNYKKYVASYKSDGLKIYGLLTVPNGNAPDGGWPVIIFNHGYIPPEQYKTTERYVAYTDAFSHNGYVLFKSDYRGHGSSEGEPLGTYYSPAYTADVLNALASVKRLNYVNPEKIGMWGHSMGGSITLRSMVISKDIKVGVIWGGVVGTYYDLANNWARKKSWQPSQREQFTDRPSRQDFIEQYGTMEENPEFWQSIDPVYFVGDISGPVQLHHAFGDDDVPYLFSTVLKGAMGKVSKRVELFGYQTENHNIPSPYFEDAAKKSVEFFDKYLK